MEGWALLDFLKHDPELRPVPVQILSCGRNPQRAMRMGAFTYLRKPVDREYLVASLLRIKTFVDRTKKSLEHTFFWARDCGAPGVCGPDLRGIAAVAIEDGEGVEGAGA